VTTLILSLLFLVALYSIYIAARVARLGRPAGEFADAGLALPGWAVMFLLPAVVASGYGIERHLALVATYGLQAAHVGVGCALAAVAALALWNRLWLATRIAGLATPGDALGRYFDSVSLRIVMMGLALLFALPFAADILSSAGRLVEAATEGVIPRVAAIWLMAFALAVPAIVGGWRAVVLALAMQAALLAALIPFVTVLTEIVSAGPGFPLPPEGFAEGRLWDRIPGVLQNSAGIGKDVPAGGVFTALGIFSTVVALIGVVLSPAMLYLGQTAREGRAFGISAVWLLAALAGGIMVLCVPVLAWRMPGGPVALSAALFEDAPLVAAGVLLIPLVGALLAVGFFVTGGVILLTRDFVLRYLLPALSDRGRRLSVRIALGFGFFAAALMASFAPLPSAVLASVALPLSVQLLPAILGLTFLRWVTRGAVLAGMILGMIIVVFTEPPGLILFEGLFLDLPWGRWPLTIHSAVWGLAFNLLLVGLASAATAGDAGRFERARLHDAMGRHGPLRASGRAGLWAFTLVWGFLAYGPGAILGNSFFSDPVFSRVEVTLGLPSLWVWQILFWLVGVVLVWWLAFRVGLGQTMAFGLKPIRLGPEEILRTPEWLAAGLARVVARPGRRRPAGGEDREQTRRRRIRIG
jgi:solute:Na+ symporter, SSS family